MCDKTSTFLLNASTLLPYNCVDSQVLKTHIISKCKEISDIDFKSVGPYICPNCGNFSPELYKAFITRIEKHKYVRRSLRRLLLIKNHTPDSRTRSLYDEFKNHNNNKMITICKICSHKNIEILKRPIVHKIDKTKTPLKKLKKKKSKDKFAGLRPNVVVSSQNSENQHLTCKVNNRKGIKLNKSEKLNPKKLVMKVSKKNKCKNNNIARLLNDKKYKSKSSALEHFISTLV